jgi:hypothetical protein
VQANATQRVQHDIGEGSKPQPQLVSPDIAYKSMK